MRIHQEPAFVLINRPYSESSWIIEIFSKNHGRLALMAKGARRAKSKLKGVLLPFQPLLLSWTGKGEIPTLTAAEIDQSEFSLLEHELCGDALVCGFYCNELIINLLHRNDPHDSLFSRYQQAIIRLGSAAIDRETDIEPSVGKDMYGQVLREFEQILMRETGYGINLEFEADGKTKISESQFYAFQQGHGFVNSGAGQSGTVSGRVIKSLVTEGKDRSVGVNSAAELSEAKHLMRSILNQTLGNKKVVSRELFFPRAR